jgi:hypothetical protein
MALTLSIVFASTGIAVPLLMGLELINLLANTGIECFLAFQSLLMHLLKLSKGLAFQ